MADQEETFGLQNSPSGSDSRELPSDNKSEKQNGTSSKSPSSQTTYIQQVSIGHSVGLTVTASGCEPRLLPPTSGVTSTVKNKKQKNNVFIYIIIPTSFVVLSHKYAQNLAENVCQLGWSNTANFTSSKMCF